MFFRALKDSVMAFYDRAKDVMAFDALYLQSRIQWGTGTSKTCDVELDCTVVAKWKSKVSGVMGSPVAAPEQAGSAEDVELCSDLRPGDHDPDAGETMRYYYYTWMGARRRGDESAFFLMPCGITYTDGEGRVAPESEKLYHEFAALAFSSGGDNLVCMTDGAMCYRCRCEECRSRFVEHHWVNHSRKPHPELSRSENIIADVLTKETRNGKAGAQTIDHDWGLLKSKLPKNAGASNENRLARIERDLRAAQWLRFCSTHDRWPRFLAAVKRWSEAQDKFPQPRPISAPADLPDGKAPAATTCEKRGPDAAQVVVRQPLLDSRSSWQRYLLNLLCLPEEWVQSIKTALEERLGEAAAGRLYEEQWFLDLDVWAISGVEAQQVLARGDDQAEVRRVFKAMAAAQVHDLVRLLAVIETVDTSCTDADATAKLRAVGFVFGCGEVWNENDCLLDSLVQVLCWAGFLHVAYVSNEGGKEAREDICKRCRQHFLQTPPFEPRNQHGQVDPIAFLQHHRHAQAAVSYFMEHGETQNSIPLSGLEVIVHARLPYLCDKVTICASNAACPATVQLHLYNWTGGGVSGYHYDPLRREVPVRAILC
jgi:hypothetical protein